jgi:hypothetical protein
LREAGHVTVTLARPSAGTRDTGETGRWPCSKETLDSQLLPLIPDRPR